MSLQLHAFWLRVGTIGIAAILAAGVAGLAGTAGLAGFAAGADPGQDPRELFARGNRLYEEGRFAEAAKTLQELADSGFESAALYFNLGNALLKSGELGEAIVYYERARSIDPRANDIRANLAYARSLVVDVMPATESSGFLEALVRLQDSISASETLWAGALLLWLTTGALAVARMSRDRSRRVARAVALGFAILLALVVPLAAVKVHETAGQKRAVLVSPEVAVRAGPGESFSSRFSLHEGTVVKVEREAASGWAEIELTETLSGWVPVNALMNL